MKAAPFPIAVIGNANLDLVGGLLADWPEQGTEIFLDRADSRIGGSAANTALVLQRLGAVSGLIASAGSDAVGTMIAEAFAAPLDRIARVEAPTSVTFGLLHPGAERTFFSTPGHLDRFDMAQVRAGLADWPLDGALAMMSGAFALPALTRDSLSLMRDLRARGAQIAIDPGWPGGGWTDTTRALVQGWIAESALVLINDKELVGLTGANSVEGGLNAMVGQLPEDCVLVVKCGPDGAIALRDGETFSATSPRADIFDTIGAGDAFNAGFLAALQVGLDLQTCLRAGSAVASAVIRIFPRSTGTFQLSELLA
ncbi:carbohydrate kinase family protein [Epibacterium sp. Ofav1-8]|uniref:carbohydrate kinase family protein n=1 Tax=Epibacterium sp. Ofav1-8 TaxID=2917735 RepID=UPI001EF49CC5|nr:PfkB family carbohydrate kinase [Epibacterium sp. Ofav1-8]MCG7622170.1 PfkB family carbohydrate kinase [Epibacterium sp. Ofav1-8]